MVVCLLNGKHSRVVLSVEFIARSLVQGTRPETVRKVARRFIVSLAAVCSDGIRIELTRHEIMRYAVNRQANRPADREAARRAR